MRKSAPKKILPKKILGEKNFRLLLKVLLFKLRIPALLKINGKKQNLKKSLLANLPKGLKKECEAILDLNQDYVTSNKELKELPARVSYERLLIQRRECIEKNEDVAAIDDELKKVKKTLIDCLSLQTASKLVGMDIEDLLSGLKGKYVAFQYTIPFVRSLISYDFSQDIHAPLEFKIGSDKYNISILNIASIFGVWPITLDFPDIFLTYEEEGLKPYQAEIRRAFVEVWYDRVIPDLPNKLVISEAKKNSGQVPEALPNRPKLLVAAAEILEFFWSVDIDRYDVCCREKDPENATIAEYLRILRSEDKEQIERLVKGKTGPKGSTALLELCYYKETEGVRRLLEAGADSNETDDDEITPLTCAIHANCLPVIKLLISANADVKAAFFKRTALNQAFLFNRVEIFQYLLTSKRPCDDDFSLYECANRLIRFRRKDTSILDAIDRFDVPKATVTDILFSIAINNSSMFEWYIKQPHWTENNYREILWALLIGSRTELCLIFFRTLKASISQEFINFCLEEMVRINKPELARILLEHGAKPNSSEYAMPLMEIALLLKSEKIIDLLISFSVEPPSFPNFLKSRSKKLIQYYFKKFGAPIWNEGNRDAWHLYLRSKPKLNIVLELLRNAAPLESHKGNTALASALYSGAPLNIIQALMTSTRDIEELDAERINSRPDSAVIYALFDKPLAKKESAEVYRNIPKSPGDSDKPRSPKRNELLNQLVDVKRRWYSCSDIPQVPELSQHDKLLTAEQLQDKIKRFEQKIQINQPSRILKGGHFSLFPLKIPDLDEAVYCKKFPYALFCNTFTLLDCSFMSNAQIICDKLEVLVENFNDIPEEELAAFQRKLYRMKLINGGAGIKSLGGNIENPNYSALLEFRTAAEAEEKTLPVLFEVKIRSSEARLLIAVLESDDASAKKILIPCAYLKKGLHTEKDKHRKIFRGGILSLNSPNKQVSF